MTANERIERYLGLFRLRLQQLNLSRGVAAIAIAALAITLIAVTVAIRTGFPDGLMLTARLLLLAVILGLAIALVVLPNRRVRDDGIDSIETRTPDFDGRVRTWADTDDETNPFRELLAEDAMRIADEEPPQKRIPQREFTRTLAAAGAAFTALLLLGIAGPGNYGYGVRDFWLGWLVPGIAPPQSIDVTPGDSGIRAGGTVRVRAVMNGFAPGEASVHARFGDDDWQQVDMANADGSFEFTFFSVREPLEYYVSAASVRSPAYRISVVDLPGIERLTNTYEWPAWTGREPETRDPGGDVRAIADTSVEVAITGTDALPDGVLIVDDREIPLDVEGENASASFTVAEDGQYYVAAVVGGERIRLTDDYFISVLDDEPPSVEFVKPGRDWSASPVEEVTARIAATDDFRIESLELFYSVNGGEWASVNLEPGGQDQPAEHVFMLESLLA
ncbi:MAG: DUF4175 family protein, partial [Woeseiaceae bacterium]|nr:DUF4175 family protein [Woeseiaceae bacterium]